LLKRAHPWRQTGRKANKKKKKKKKEKRKKKSNASLQKPTNVASTKRS